MSLRLFTEPQQGATYDQLLALAGTGVGGGFEAFFRWDQVHILGYATGLPGYTEACTTLAALGVAGQTTGEPVDHEVVVDEAATVAAVVEQADARGLGVTPHEAREVVAGLLAYLQAISAVGPEAEDG
jgi:hypothetical protein